MADAVGAGDDHPVLGAEIDIRRFAEIAGGQHVPEIILRKVQPQQYPGDFALMLHRGVEHSHYLVGDPGCEHLHAALPLHSGYVVVPVPAIVGLAV